jgi:hypothetical protein
MDEKEIILDPENVLDRYPAEVLEKVQDFILDNNAQQDSLKICSVWYEFDELRDHLYFMTKAKRHFSRRNMKLEDNLMNLELEVMSAYNFNLSILALPLGNKSDIQITGGYGYEKVFEYLKP